MSGALNSVFGGGGILGAALNVASMCFPPLAIASSLGNLITQGLGQAVGQAAQTLTQVAGMPKFIAQEVQQVVKQVVDQLTQHSDPHCDEEVKNQVGGAFDDFKSQFSKDLVKYAVEGMGSEKAKGTKGGGSWFEALAAALGKALNDQSETVKGLSDAVVGKSSTDDPKAFTDLQAASQRMSFMMSAADQVIKTLGEALGTMARKQ
jgi:flagellar hook-basal body complex protein FliE